MSKKKTNFEQSMIENNVAFMAYYNRLKELAMIVFEWKNLPETVDERFLELSLYSNGSCLFFKDDVLGYLALKSANSGPVDVYNIPTRRRAYSASGYSNELTNQNSVIIFNNYIHSTSAGEAEIYARRLWNLDRIIDVNSNAQKTPVIITCDENERLTMINLFKEIDGNSPVIFGGKALNVAGVKALNIGAPYVADKIYDLKQRIWNEALTNLGITNTDTSKRERLITDEVNKNQGGVIASRYSRLQARQQACKQINRMFNLDVSCDYREQLVIDASLPNTEGLNNE